MVLDIAPAVKTEVRLLQSGAALLLEHRNRALVSRLFPPFTFCLFNELCNLKLAVAWRYCSKSDLTLSVGSGDPEKKWVLPAVLSHVPVFLNLFKTRKS